MTQAIDRRELKKALKEAFPFIKFSCTNYHYNGTMLRWYNGPTEERVKKVIDKGEYNLGYTVVQREITHEVFKQIAETYCKAYSLEYNEDHTETNDTLSISQLVHTYFNVAEFVGSNPTITALESTGLCCGCREETQFLNWEEKIKGKLYKCDAESIKAEGERKEKQFREDVEKAKKEREEAEAAAKERQEKWEALKKKFDCAVTTIEGKEIDGFFPWCNYKNDLYMHHVEDYNRGDYRLVNTKIRSLVCCNSVMYKAIKENLLTNYEFLKEIKQGTESPYDPPKEYEGKDIWQWTSEMIEEWRKDAYELGTLIYCPALNSGFLINPQGYNYCRYVAIIPAVQKMEIINKAKELQGLSDD